MTFTLYLAYAAPAVPALSVWDWDADPVSILVAYPYSKMYLQHATVNGYRPARTVLDSGAFSAHNSGKVIDHDALLGEVKSGRWHEAVCLDVIGSANGSRRNAEYALANGATNAWPVFHIGDPWELLDFYCANWDKVGLSCRFGESQTESLRFYDQCFARQWPHRFHSFGWIARDTLLRYPFQSGDSSSWELGPAKFRSFHGTMRGLYQGVKFPIMAAALKGQILHYLELEREVRTRWEKELSRWET